MGSRNTGVPGRKESKEHKAVTEWHSSSEVEVTSHKDA